MASYHVASLKSNDVSATLRSGTFALKWPEEHNKPVVSRFPTLLLTLIDSLDSRCGESLRRRQRILSDLSE